jgi:serine/threonine-protein kinase/endoribonuclease IRE1
VLKGTWGLRPVAVKRLVNNRNQHCLAKHEVKLLQESDDHRNVIRYYCQERRDEFLYIALDLCKTSLAEMVLSPEKHPELVPLFDNKNALLQVTEGLGHLHNMNIIHRDIKPQ